MTDDNNNEPLSQQDAMAALATRLNPESEQGPTGEQQGRPPNEGGDEAEPQDNARLEGGDAREEAGAEDADTKHEEEELPPIELPVAWSDADKEAFLALPPEVQQTIAQRESEREAVLTKRAQQSASEVREAQTLRAQLQSEREQYVQALAPLIQQLQQAVMVSDAELNKLLEEGDTHGYLTAKARADARKQQLLNAQAQQQAILQQQQTEMQRQQGELAKAAHERLIDALPHLADQAKLDAETADMQGYLKSEGFSNDELAVLNGASATDHRLTVIARKAMLYDKLQKTRPKVTKKVANKPKLVRPGAARSKDYKAAERESRSLDALRKNPRSREAAMKAFAQRLSP